MNNKKIIPAVLSLNEGEVISQMKQFDGFVDFVQFDVADGQFVNNITCRPAVLKDLLKKTKLEIHLMVANPLTWLEECCAVNATRVYLHVETNVSAPIINAFTQKGIEVFLAINPDTPIEVFDFYKEVIPGVLFLGVQPGKQGQEFIPAVLEKIISFKERYPDKIIVVDGGLKQDNLKIVSLAGADWLVCGSAIMTSANPVEEYKRLSGLL